MNSPPTEAAFRDWYRKTSVRVFAYVRRHCDPAEVDDIVAETYLAAWRRRDDLPADAVPWLIGTARKVLANHWRSRGRRQRLASELAGVAHLADPDCAGQAVERADLLAALGRLRPDDRDVLLLAGWDGLDAAGLATVLDCTPPAARARLSRARRRLAAELDGRPTPAPTDPDHRLRLVKEVS